MIQTIDQYIDPNCYGGKAASLSFLNRNGFSVPNAFVISSNATQSYLLTGQLNQELADLIGSALRAMPSETGYMVRSSALGEDAADTSFAGQLSSFRCSDKYEDVIAHVLLCLNSYRNENVTVYQSASGKTLKGMAVVVQCLVNPDFAGVTFSRAPDKYGFMLTEYVEGHGEKLVGGEVNPQRVYYSRHTGKQSGDSMSVLKDVFEKAAAIEKIYKCAVDIEWVIESGKVLFVQARPVTTRLAGRQVFWSNTNINENYPDPVSPLLYSIARDAYYHYFRNLGKYFQLTGEQLRDLEADLANIVGSFGGRLYYNMSSIHAVLSASPFPGLLLKSFDNFVGYEGDSRLSVKSSTFRQKAGFIKNIFWADLQLERNVRDFEKIADQYNKLGDAAIDLQDLKTSFHQFLEIRMHSWYRASLADFFAMIYHGLLGKFTKKYYGNDFAGIHNQLIQAIPGLISTRPVVAMHQILSELKIDKNLYEVFCKKSAAEFWVHLSHSSHASVQNLIKSYLLNYGFRCSGELMLTEDTYLDRPELFIALLQNYNQLAQDDPQKLIQEKQAEARRIRQSFIKKIFVTNKLNVLRSILHVFVLRFLIRKASAGIAARERVRLKQALLYYRFKKICERCGDHFLSLKLIEKRLDIFYLRYKEIAENLTASDPFSEQLTALISSRQKQRMKEAVQRFPDDFYSEEGVYLKEPKTENVSIQGSAKITGLSACGGTVHGTARVLNSIHEAGKLKKGDILITRQTDPGWVVVFPLISGLIVERGGMLSHGAIVSREFGIPAIVGVSEATLRIPDGSEIVLNADHGIIEVC